ncbi:hypothetical protein CLU79DRAFT_551936 [Phycomyces nitens]|nr:hypothetical protein CLU79DRAFT_551936 [Phycomyces nitens]
MLLSDFPQEIIDKVIDLLPVKDRISCCLVCKSWNNIFQDSLYFDINIKTRHALNKILSPSSDNQPNYYNNGHLARHLLLYLVEAKDDDIYALQKIFPNVKYIHFCPNIINRENFGFTIDWHPWRLLKELYITFAFVFIPNIGRNIVKVILCLPLLTRLEIGSKRAVLFPKVFSLNDLETIHSHLKHLEHLALNSVLLPVSDTDLGRVTDVLPATAMRSLEIESGKAGNRWLYYFARKYPNLRTLEFWTSWTVLESKEKIENTTTLFDNAPPSFQHLTKLDLTNSHCNDDEEILFRDITNFDNVPLKQVSISIDSSNDSYPDNVFDVSKRIIEACLTKYSKTIESFYLQYQSINAVPMQSMEMETTLCNLVKLDIDMPISIDLDAFLCTAPRLKSLVLYDADIKVRDKLYTSKRFGLESLALFGGKITSDVLRFLSFHCRGLNELDLTRLSVYGNFTTPGCQFIDMTYSRIETLFIYSTEFIIKDNNECPDNVNIALITRPVEDIAPKQDYDPNVQPNVIGAPTKAYYHWFYASEPQDMNAISKAQSSRIMKFISNYEENKRITLERAHIKIRKPSKRWKRRCVFGYTKIKLGYVADYRSSIDITF